ncbi:pYEATS domain-containing protein [Sandarakinorhabdus cyanobacteriorum]|nr:pYEATS domain-containing protein [Sandarakinorhabdus cyanobacteriorum]
MSTKSSVLTRLPDAPQLMKQAEAAAEPREKHGSAIVVITTAAGGGSAPLSPMRLYNERDVAMRADREAGRGVDLQQDEAIRYYDVPPGTFLLSFAAQTGETMQQTVPALPGRRTFVLCEGSTAKVLVAAGQGFEQLIRAGIDPARTVIVSVRGDETDDRIRERVRLARVLLHDIATGGSSLDNSLLAILDNPTTDPLLRLYGAATVVARLTSRQSPLAGETWPKRGIGAFRQQWVERAIAWLRVDKAMTIGPDETVLRWRLGEMGNSRRRLQGQRRIARPPMLAQVWRWAVEASIDEPAVIEQTAAIIAVTRSAVGAEPWLCWKAAAAKAAPSALPPARRSSASIYKLVAEAMTKAREIGSVGLDAILEQLTPEAGAAAVNLGKQINQVRPDIAELAVSLGLPASALLRRLNRTSQEIDAVLANSDGADRKGSKGVRVEAPISPPAMSRPIQEPDDPQKGRFGGIAERHHFVLSAQFFATRNPGWTRIRLTIAGPARDGELARFYVHDSFVPPELEGSFLKGRASVEVTAWGGFTVGGWIPSAKLELELDLAQMPDAPEPIRTR